jgi:hypothetical protein
LANTAIQKNDTLEKLIEMNNQKDKVIASLSKSLEDEKRTNGTLLFIISNAGIRMGGGGTTNQQGTGRGQDYTLDPHGYCWSHGYKVKLGHSSLTCTRRQEGHKEGATRTNTMGGRDFNKDWKPHA